MAGRYRCGSVRHDGQPWTQDVIPRHWEPSERLQSGNGRLVLQDNL